MSLVPFSPPWYARNPHFQTISAHLLGHIRGYKPHQLGLLNESVVLPAQAGGRDRLFLNVHRFQRADRRRTPAAVLVHGLEGSSESVYILSLTRKLLSAGFHVIRMNLRGCGQGRHMARNPYNAGLTIDVETVLEFVEKEISPLIALIGISIGANIILKYLGEDQAERNRQRINYGAKPLRRRRAPRYAKVFAAVSPPLDLYAACECIDSPAASTYRNMFLREIIPRVAEGFYDNSPYGPEEAGHITTWFDFDHAYVAPTGGFPGAIEYYRHCASRYYVHTIDIPGLVLHAYDDPLINPIGWEETNWSNMPHITAHLTGQGGHVGWLGQKHPYFPDRRWMDYRVMSYMTEWRDSLFPAGL
ncbi:MAG: alpha/beta fold hydrolase [Spirochaetia bacterium]|nr:alpha/beta fold hydrolase [Spirochaetia bacterium]